jgi:glycosyltransferase involved in cell wall biosynthesis
MTIGVRGEYLKEKVLKVLLFANTSWYLYNFRLPLACALRDMGSEVVLLSPGEEPYHHLLQEEGFTSLTIPMRRERINPLSEIQTLWQILRVYRHERPEIVHHFTVKPVLYGSFAAHLMHIRRIINAVPGLGYLFSNTSFKANLLRYFATQVYKVILRNTQVIFQNPDDAAHFIQNKLVEPQQSTLIRGSGVDINRFVPTEETRDVPLIVLPSRMLWDKGIQEFVDAAKNLKAKGIQARFVLAGSPDIGNPRSIPLDTLEKWNQEGSVEWWGWCEDMLSVYRAAHIVCLPSYREGTPKTLIEAAACGRAIVAADVPGCREVVQNGYNGLLVPVKESNALAAALHRLIQNPEERFRMGKNGRQLAVDEFSTQRVVAETLNVYNKFGLYPNPVQI